MQRNKDPPSVYVLPPTLFDAGEKINMGDVEFPIYLNFFIKCAFLDKNKRVVFVGRPAQLESIKVFFSESVFGPAPEHLYLTEDIDPEYRAAGYDVNFAAERDYLAYKDADTGQAPPLDSFARFLPLSPGGSAVYAGPDDKDSNPVRITIRDHVIKFEEVLDHDQAEPDASANFELRGVLDVSDSAFDPSANRTKSDISALDSLGTASEQAPAGHNRNGSPDAARKSHEAGDPAPRSPAHDAACAQCGAEEPLPCSNRYDFDPPVFGVTFLGTSSGFDANNNTTGFIIWINGQGILVDPPVQTSDILEEAGIHSVFVKKVILTHCHSDHDSGLIHRLLAGHRCEVYTSKTVNASYVRKVNAITNSDISSFYTFRQVVVGKPINILGAMFSFDYALHTVPTIRFKCDYMGKSISYASDTHYSPAALSELERLKIINPLREIALRQFVFDADLIIHEAGVPPIHTPVTALNDLPVSVKKRMLIVHTSKLPEVVDRKLSDGTSIRVPVTDLRIPESGVEATIRISMPGDLVGYSRASRLMQMFCAAFFFRSVSASKMYDLFARLSMRHAHAGEVIIREGDVAREFFILFAGAVDIYQNLGAVGQRHVATLFRGDCFGEGSLRKEEQKRGATVIAKVSCTLYVLRSSDFFDVISSPTPSYEAPKTSVEVDLARVNKNREFVRDNVKNSFLFKDLKLDQVEYLASLLEPARSFAAGEVVIREGDTSCSLYFVSQGVVRLQKDGEEFLRLGVGECFGELALVTGLPRTATVVAHTDVVLLELQRDGFIDLLDRYQNVKWGLSRIVENRLKESEAMTKTLTRIKSQRSERLDSSPFK